MKSDHTTFHSPLVDRQARARQNGHASAIIWLTGLSGAGKSTLACALEQALHASGHRSYVLDGDNVRQGLCGDLGFSRQDRQENIRRIGEVARLMMDAGLIVITAFISPTELTGIAFAPAWRKANSSKSIAGAKSKPASSAIPKGCTNWPWPDKIQEFTGISSPYEPPQQPELTLDTSRRDITSCTQALLSLLHARKLLIR
ncbi:adenylyl-sulfate kinase [Thauera sp. SDU_THAU2]|uniref:adenylyl-sulfate kinase n=1 Tax=Thauera sp. SDU_THAU2 TaxID=3136633 RepID=UPI00311FFE6E